MGPAACDCLQRILTACLIHLAGWLLITSPAPVLLPKLGFRFFSEALGQGAFSVSGDSPVLEKPDIQRVGVSPVLDNLAVASNVPILKAESVGQVSVVSGACPAVLSELDSLRSAGACVRNSALAQSRTACPEPLYRTNH